jgi:hypothetical protein
MFWDPVLDPVRDFLSNDISKWTIAAFFAALVFTKFTSLISSGAVDSRQEVNFAVIVFLLLFGAFYLP